MKAIVLLVSAVGYISANTLIQKMRATYAIPYTDEDDDMSLTKLMQTNSEIQQNGQNPGQKDSSNDLSLLDSSSDSENAIDKEAEEFVDSDETLNAQLEQAASSHIVINSGYPYKD